MVKVNAIGDKGCKKFFFTRVARTHGGGEGKLLHVH